MRKAVCRLMSDEGDSELGLELARALALAPPFIAHICLCYPARTTDPADAGSFPDEPTRS